MDRTDASGAAGNALLSVQAGASTSEAPPETGVPVAPGGSPDVGEAEGQQDDKDCNSYAAKRDETLERFIAINPATPQQLVQLGLFRRAAKARERLRVLEREERVHNENKPQHAFEVTEAILCFPDAVQIRRLSVPHEADAVFTLADKTYYLELDRDTMKLAEIRHRMKKYDGCAHDVLWVCPSRSRVEDLRTIAPEAMEFWFTTFDELLANSNGMIWVDRQGMTTHLATRDATQDAVTHRIRAECYP